MGRTPRWAMQSLGAEWGRDLIHPELWVNHWKALACETLDHGRRVVTDDIRFPNEVVAVKSSGGTVVRVERPGVAAQSHSSEAMIMYLPADLTITNDGSLAKLRAAARSMVAS
jgi:hypothetical protein